MNEGQAREEILHATLANVVFDGWTDHALRNGALAAGFDRAAAVRFFPDGVPEAVALFSANADRAMEDALARHDLTSLPMPRRVALAVRCRLESLVGHREAVRHALAYCALPLNLGLGTRLLVATADRLCYAVGDDSTDFRYYTRRAALAAMLTVTTLYWIDDQSDGFEDTWAFLERRIDSATALGGDLAGFGRFEGLGNRMPSPRRFFNQVGRYARSL